MAIYQGAREEVGDGIWNLVNYRTLLGRIDERTSRKTGLLADTQGVLNLLAFSPTIVDDGRATDESRMRW